MFDAERITRDLERNRGVFERLLAGRGAGVQAWRPAPGKWSLLEIVCHLYDEERDDFRTRVRCALETPGAQPPPIDPEGWVASRGYAGQDYDAKLAAFLSERAESVAWLRSLRSPRWESGYQHPKLGPMSARMFLACWLAHDHLHLRQILRYDYERLKQESGEDLGYAGSW